MMRDTKVRVEVSGASVEFITVELRQVRCAEGSATRSPTEKSEKKLYWVCIQVKIKSATRPITDISTNTHPGTLKRQTHNAKQSK